MSPVPPTPLRAVKKKQNWTAFEQTSVAHGSTKGSRIHEEKNVENTTRKRCDTLIGSQSFMQQSCATLFQGSSNKIWEKHIPPDT